MFEYQLQFGGYLRFRQILILNILQSDFQKYLNIGWTDFRFMVKISNCLTSIDAFVMNL